MFLLSEGECLTLPADALGTLESPVAHLEAKAEAGMAASFQRARAQALADFECRFVRRALAQSAGNVSLAARRAGKERRSFGRLLKKHGIDRKPRGTGGSGLGCGCSRAHVFTFRVGLRKPRYIQCYIQSNISDGVDVGRTHGDAIW